MRGAEDFALLDSEEGDGAIRVANREHLAVWPPRQACDWRVEASVRKKALPSHRSVDEEL